MSETEVSPKVTISDRGCFVFLELPGPVPSMTMQFDMTPKQADDIAAALIDHAKRCRESIAEAICYLPANGDPT